VFRDGQADFEARFKTARAAGDIDTATRMAHDLKSMAAALGIHAVQPEAETLEEACRRRADDIDALGQRVARRLGPVITSLQVLGPKHAA
jgi:HPt (histidine-containing phosphotransfer) domain-containing protein